MTAYINKAAFTPAVWIIVALGYLLAPLAYALVWLWRRQVR